MTKDDLENELIEVKELARNSTRLKQENIDKLENHYLRWRQIVEKCDYMDLKFLKHTVLLGLELEEKQFCSQLAFLATRMPRISVEIPKEKVNIGIDEIIRSLKGIGDSNTMKAVRAIYQLPDPVQS